MHLNNLDRVSLATIAILVLAVTTAHASDSKSPTSAEQKLLRAVRAGETADFSLDSDKTISAEFLKKLMFGTPEAQLPSKRIVLKKAIVQFFDVRTDQKAKSTESTPFEIVFYSCNFADFICEGCRFRRDLRFVNTTFGVNAAGTGQLVLTGAELDGNLEVVNNNTLNVSVDNARITGVASFSLPPSTGLGARRLKAQALQIQASSHLNFSADHAEVQDINIRVDGDGSGTSDVRLPDVVAGSVMVTALGEGLALNASGLRANTAFFLGGPPLGSNSKELWTPVIAYQPTLRRANIDNLDIDGLQIDYLDASGLTVKDAVFGVDAKYANLSASTFNTLNWSLHSFPETTVLDGISFQRFNVAPFPGSRLSISSGIEFLRKADFSGSGFSAYQAQLRSQGENVEADNLYVVMREKVRLRYWEHWFTWPLGVVDLFQQYVLGYGRSPTPPLLWSLLFVIFGTFAFHDVAKMQPKVEKPIEFSSTWYSLELFLPIVDLGVAKEWRPGTTSQWRVIYARVHQIAGWILIPVSLAAFTGVVK